MTIRRGDIFYVDKYGDDIGSEQSGGRPAIIVSSEATNSTSTVVVVVYMTTSPKKDLPTHVTIRSAPKISTALCEQITSISVTRLQSCVGHCTDDEMSRIDTALSISLGLNVTKAEKAVSKPQKALEMRSDKEAMILELATERAYKNAYKRLYEELLTKCISGGVLEIIAREQL